MAIDEMRRRQAVPAAAPAAPMGSPAPMASPMGGGMLLPGQVTAPVNNVGIWQPGMQPNHVDPDTVGTGLTGGTIGTDQIRAASETLKKYKQGKQNLEDRIIKNEDWFKLRHWDSIETTSKSEVKPTSAWLFNCIANKHASAMDNFPSPNILPREAADKQEAKMLTSIIPVVLDQTGFEDVYDALWDQKLTSGTGVYSVVWDQSKLNGLGDIAIRSVDILNLFWEPGVTDIQNSRNFFHVELRDNDLLEAEYPVLKGNTGDSSTVSKYEYDDTVDTQNKSAVIDWYYKKITPDGRELLHFVKFAGKAVLYSSEDDPVYAERGFYDHGKYPVVFDVLFPEKGTPVGFGYVAICKDPQLYIDKLFGNILNSIGINRCCNNGINIFFIK